MHTEEGKPVEEVKVSEEKSFTDETKGPEESKALVVKSLSIDKILKEYDQIKGQIDDADGDVSNELQVAHDYVMDLMSNKVDEVVELHGLLENRLDILKAQTAKTKTDIETLEYWTSEVLKHMNVDDLNGIYNRISFRASSAVIVTDDKVVPNNCKKIRVEFSQDIDCTDERMIGFFRSVILKRKITPEAPVTPEEQLILDKHMTVNVRKDELKKLLKIGEVPGAHVESRKNIQFQPGKAKIKAAKKTKEVREVLNESNG